MEAYQERLIMEKTELDSKIDKLREFLAEDFYKDNIFSDEQKRLCRQELIMRLYSDVLGDRIDAFHSS